MDRFTGLRVARRDALPFEPGALSRMQLLAGTAGLLLAGCAGRAATSVLPSARTPSALPDMLRALGYVSVTDPRTKQTIYATGYSPPTIPGAGRSTNDCLNYASGRRSVKDVCGSDVPPDPATEGAIEVDLPVIGSTMVVSPPVSVQGPSPFAYYAIGGMDGLTGPTYGLASFSMTRCLAAESAFAGSAWQAAQYISTNAGQFSQAVVNSARNAIAQWQGTGMGISAAATFLFGVAASVPAAVWLQMCLAIGLSGATAYLVFNCLANGISDV